MGECTWPLLEPYCVILCAAFCVSDHTFDGEKWGMCA